MDLVNALFFILPAYFANAAPVISRGKTPVDLGSNLKKHRVFGQSKTIRGVFLGITAGTLAGLALSSTPFYFPSLSFTQRLQIAFLTSAGAMAGDLLGSFVKRRLDNPSGAQFILLDQLPFIYAAMLFAAFVAPLSIDALDVLFLTLLTLVLHPAANHAAFKLGLKKVPW